MVDAAMRDFFEWRPVGEQIQKCRRDHGETVTTRSDGNGGEERKRLRLWRGVPLVALWWLFR